MMIRRRINIASVLLLSLPTLISTLAYSHPRKLTESRSRREASIPDLQYPFYRWVSNESLLTWQGSSFANAKTSLYSTRTKKLEPVQSIDDALNAIAQEAGNERIIMTWSVLSPRGQQIAFQYGPFIGPPDGWAVANVVGREWRKGPTSEGLLVPDAPFAWTPDSRLLVTINPAGDLIQMSTLDARRLKVTGRRYLKDISHLCRLWRQYPLHTVYKNDVFFVKPDLNAGTVEIVRIPVSLYLAKRRISTIRLPVGETLAEVTMSGSGRKLAWLLKKPHLEGTTNNVITYQHEIYVSGSDGSTLTHIPVGKDIDKRAIGYLQWMPDDSRLSFLSYSTIYSVPIKL